MVDDASMGPLFFRAENVERCGISSGGMTWLQWGRSFSERRTPIQAILYSRQACFNGAALFQSGERDRLFHGVYEPSRRFNGAALFQSGEPDAVAMYARHRALQWGRSFSERRTTHGVFPRASVPSFNGAALFQSGEHGYALDRSAGPVPASMGPLFFRAENIVGVRLSELNASLASMGPLFFRAENRSNRSSSR